MTVAAIGVTIGVKFTADGVYAVTPKTGAAPTASSIVADSASLTTHNTSATTHAATVAANVATLVADGATPTQAHVNTLNTNYALLATDLTNIAADTTAIAADATAVGGGLTGDVVISLDLSKVVSINALKAALNAILLQARAMNLVPEAV